MDLLVEGQDGMADEPETPTHAQKVLAAIEAVLENRATQDQDSLSIGNRQLRRTPIADLLLLRDKYKSEVAIENNRSLIASGRKTRNRIKVRF